MQQQLIYITLAVVLALTFQPLRRIFEKATDRIFFRDRYDTQTVLNSIGQILTSERLLDKLMHDILIEICRNLRLTAGRFIVLEDGKIVKSSYFGPVVTSPIDVADLHKLSEQMIVADKLDPDDMKLKILKAHNTAVCVPLPLRKQLVGFLLLGDKRSGSVYSRQDLNLLQVVAPGLAVATNNAQAYAQISQFNVTLQQEVQHATHSLRVANKNLKALDKAKDEFLSITSHQLRTPLATIEGYISILDHGDVGEVTPQQKHFLKSAAEATARMSDIVTEILDISTVSAGQPLIRPEPENLEALVEHEVESLKSMAETKGLELRYKQPAHPLPAIELDKGKTQQIISNFIDNAIHYTSEGSIDVVLEESGGAVRFTVTDTGIGVPEAEQAKLFDKFFRGSNARQIRPDGSGLGLFLAKQVIKAQHGRFIFKSHEGEGSTFGFEIPLATPAKSETAK